MSAIFGILGDSDIAEIDRMGERLSHRGSYTETWNPSSRLRFGKRTAALEECRFADYVDFSGFIDNRVDIAERLGWQTPELSSSADERLVYEVYRKWGPAGFNALSGQFAVAIWDDRRSALVLARDAWASCPLFWTRARDRYIFASEYKALLCFDDVPARPNRDAIQFIHCTKYSPPDSTCLAGIRPVPAGGWIEIAKGRFKEHRYIEIAPTVDCRSDSEHENLLRDNFVAAVSRQASPHDPIGISLSGGLDSALIVGTVKKVLPDREVRTFTASFGKEDPEIREAAAVARYFETKHEEVFLSPSDLPSLMPMTLWHMEDPIGREEKLFYYVTARAASKHVTLLLAGHNADGLFGGMPRHRVVRAASYAPLFTKPLEDFYNYTQTGAPAESLLGRLLVRLYFMGNQIRPPAVIGADAGTPSASFPKGQSEPLSGLLRQVMLEDPNANAAIERLHSAFGVRFNSPFLDTDLVHNSFSIPDRLKIRGWRQKYILRCAGRGLLPDEMLNRRKGLLRLRHDRQFSDVIEEMSGELLHSAAVREREIFPVAYVEHVRRRPATGVYPTDQLYRLWSLLMSEIWARQYLDCRGAPPTVPSA